MWQGGQGCLYHHHLPSWPAGGGKWLSFHEPFEKVDQSLTILFVICDKACQVHHEHQTHFAWTGRWYINHKVQSLPIRNGSDPATHSWTVLCCHQHSDPMSIPGRRHSGQQHVFIIFVFPDPLSLFHSSQVRTFLSITIQHRRTEIQSVTTSLQRKLWKETTWRSSSFCLQFNIYSWQLFPLTKINAKSQSTLTDMNNIFKQKAILKKQIIRLGFPERNEQVDNRAKLFLQ